MSIVLMGAVKRHSMPDLKTNKDETVSGSTSKFILLMYADAANDDGLGAYPGIRGLAKMTQYSLETVCNGVNALRHNDYLIPDGISPRKTNNYRINLTKLGVQVARTPRSGSPNTPVQDSRTNPLREIEDSEVFTALAELQGGALNGAETHALDKWREYHEQKWIMKAIAIAKEKGARSWKYVDSTLAGWAANGYPKTFEQKIDAAKQKKQQPKTPKASIPDWKRKRVEASYA